MVQICPPVPVAVPVSVNVISATVSSTATSLHVVSVHVVSVPAIVQVQGSASVPGPSNVIIHESPALGATLTRQSSLEYAVSNATTASALLIAADAPTLRSNEAVWL